MTLEQEIAHLRLKQVPVTRYRDMPWYRRLTEEQRHTVETRIGICVGAGDCTVEAYALAKREVYESRTL